MSILRLIPHELKKLFSNRFVAVFLILLLAFNAALCAFGVRDQNMKDEIMEESYDKFPILRTYVAKVIELYENDPEFFLSEYERITSSRDFTYLYGEQGYSDKAIFETAYAIVCANAIYHKQLSGIVKQAKALNRNISFLGALQNNYYLYRYNEQIIERYGALDEKVTLKSGYTVGWSAYFGYTEEVFLTLGVLTLFVVYLAVSDKKSGFSAICGCTRYGRWQTAAEKYISILMITCIVTILFSISSLASVGVRFGYSDVFEAVQAVPGMDQIPFAMTILESLFYLVGIKMIAMCLYAALLFTLTTVCKSYVFGFGAGAAIIAANYFITTFSEAEIGQWGMLNLLSLYAPNSFIIRYRAVNLFDYPINLFDILLIVFALVLLVGFGICCALYAYGKGKPILRAFPRRHLHLYGVKEKIVSFLPRRRVHRHPLSTIFWEFFKSRALYLVLVLLLVLKCFMSSSYYRPVESAAERYYKQYLAMVEGPYSEEKTELLKEQLSEVNAIIGAEDKMQSAYTNEELTLEEYRAYYNDLTVAEQYQKPALQSLVKYADYLHKQYENTGVVGAFVHETGYLLYHEQGVDWVLLLFLVLLGTRFYLVEYEKRNTESPMCVIVQTTGRGRGYLFCKKLILHLLTVTGVFVLFRGIDIWYLTERFTLPDASYRLFSLTHYQNAHSSLTLGGYTVWMLIASFVGLLMLSLLIFWLTIYLKKTVLTYATMLLLLVMPHLMVLTGSTVGNYFDLTGLQNTNRLYLYSLDTHGGIGWFVGFFIFVLTLTALLGVLSYRKIQKGIQH